MTEDPYAALERALLALQSPNKQDRDNADAYFTQSMKSNPVQYVRMFLSAPPRLSNQQVC